MPGGYDSAEQCPFLEKGLDCFLNRLSATFCWRGSLSLMSASLLLICGKYLVLSVWRLWLFNPQSKESPLNCIQKTGYVPFLLESEKLNR